MKTRTLLLTCLLLALPFTASAKIAGHNVILIHGFHSEDLTSALESRPVSVAVGLPARWSGNSTPARLAESAINWDGSQRIEGAMAVSVYQQVKAIARQGLCTNYCILITHSTGDLVARYMLENQARWLKADGLPPLKILCSLDIAGAGGGTELANIAVSAAYMGLPASNFPVIRQALLSLLHGTQGHVFSIGDLGVVNDLQTTTARQIALTPGSVPRFRVVGHFPLTSSLASIFKAIGL